MTHANGESATGFSSAQYDDAYPPGVEASFWHVARNAIIARELEASGMSRAPLLEIGCGRGIIVDYLRQRGMDAMGCDLATPVVPARLASAVLTATDFKSLPAEQRTKIGGVLLCDVLEHLPTQGSLLREVVDSLPNVRHVLITVPSRAELWSGWDDHFGHHRRYDREMLAAEITGAGLTPVSMRYFFHALYGPMFAARGRRRDTTIAAPAMPGIHRLLGRAFILERQLVPRWVPGTSLIAVAKT